MKAGSGHPVRIPASAHTIQAGQICPRADSIIKRLQKAGFEAYLVGGCVRDMLLGVTPKDFDIATSAHPEQVRKLFSSARLIGRRFRLAHIYFGRDYLEVATFRAPHDESNHGLVNEHGRIIHDNVYGTLEEDVWRRDFSINALFYDPVTGDVIDFVNGMLDLQQRRLRLIGEPEQRYREDPVRMMRALRFAAKLDCTLVDQTSTLIKPLAHLLNSVAPARLFDELLKLLHSGHGWNTFCLLEAYGLLPYLLPITHDSLVDDEDGVFRKLLQLSLQNTDRRIAEGLSVMPPFLFAVLLWDEVYRELEFALEDGHPETQAMNIAATDVLRDQVKVTAIPRRFSNITREIWGLQSRFSHRDLRRANVLHGNARFRAAYDFLCLRAASGEPGSVKEDSEWWTTFQEASPEDRQAMSKTPGKKRRRSKRKGKTATAD